MNLRVPLKPVNKLLSDGTNVQLEKKRCAVCDAALTHNSLLRERRTFRGQQFCTPRGAPHSLSLSNLNPFSVSTVFTHTRSNFENCLRPFILHPLNLPTPLLPYTGTTNESLFNIVPSNQFISATPFLFIQSTSVYGMRQNIQLKLALIQRMYVSGESVHFRASFPVIRSGPRLRHVKEQHQKRFNNAAPNNTTLLAVVEKFRRTRPVLCRLARYNDLS
ncbi:hypothetical protein ANN_17923 [Periplaneta americana]|uniref:Uncharacterized protein n=1 Tax=Periplaneta americana TaxID=6978 RepID=A0ABQ8SMB9_PERAM|nr:hypothetical protein ANN_17923 [Periplaneta americana]